MARLPPCGQPSKTGILSLPDELLLVIFNKVKTYRPANKALHPDFASSSADIAAVRLTCRRFAATSSHLLVHYIRLDSINSHSLDRLEAISRHPLVSKGVRIIRLELRCYAPTLAKDIGEFSRWAAKRVLNLARYHRRTFEKEVEESTYEDPNTAQGLMKKRDELATLLGKLRTILDMWSSVSVNEENNLPTNCFSETAKDNGQTYPSEIDSHVEAHPYMKFLRKAHDLYRRRFEDQEELRKNNVFVVRFVEAMSRMPKVKHLEVQDFQHEPSTCLTCCDGNNVARAFRTGGEPNQSDVLLDIDTLVEPMSWAETREHEQHYSTPPAELLFSLPVAIQNKGCHMESILVRTTTRAESFALFLRDSIYRDCTALSHACHAIGLKSFAFIQSTSSTDQVLATPVVEDFGPIKGYIAAMTSSKMLERVRLALDGILETQNALSFGDVLVSMSMTNLKDIHVTGLSVHLEDLKNFHNIMEGQELRLEFLTLLRVRLVSGQWTEALEVLRKMTIADKEVLQPFGAECESLLLKPLHSRYESLFGVEFGSENEAGRFINGKTRQNPLQCAHA